MRNFGVLFVCLVPFKTFCFGVSHIIKKYGTFFLDSSIFFPFKIDLQPLGLWIPESKTNNINIFFYALKSLF